MGALTHTHTHTHIKIYGVITILPCYNMCKAMMKPVRISYDTQQLGHDFIR